MRRLFTALLFLSLILCDAVARADINPGGWNIKKSEHFILYYKDAPLIYVDEVITKAETYYNSICDEIGFTRFDKFWTWENRAVIYLFTDASEYTATTQNPGWSGAGVNIYKRKIYTFVNMQNFFDAILPHEITHIIFREYVGYRRKLPLWLDEGIACYFEGTQQRAARLSIARAISRSKIFMPIDELNEVNKLYVMIMPDLFYSESASIIEFLLTVYGKERFIEFCRNLRDLRDDQFWDIALYNTYKFKDQNEFEARWKHFLLSGGAREAS